MSEQSRFAPPAEARGVTPRQESELGYDPDDIENMKFYPGSKAERSTPTDPLALGREVSVRRVNRDTGESYSDSGWKIIKNTAETTIEGHRVAAVVVVEKRIGDQIGTKTVAAEAILALNPEAREALTTLDLSSMMGEVAINGTQEDIRPQAEQEPVSAVEERPSYDDHLINPDHTSGSVDALKHRSDVLSDELNQLVEGLEQSDKTAVWQFAAALHNYETQAALRNLSHGFEQKHPGLLAQYKSTFSQLQDVRARS